MIPVLGIPVQPDPDRRRKRSSPPKGSRIRRRAPPYGGSTSKRGPALEGGTLSGRPAHSMTGRPARRKRPRVCRPVPPPKAVPAPGRPATRLAPRRGHPVPPRTVRKTRRHRSVTNDRKQPCQPRGRPSVQASQSAFGRRVPADEQPDWRHRHRLAGIERTRLVGDDARSERFPQFQPVRDVPGTIFELDAGRRAGRFGCFGFDGVQPVADGIKHYPHGSPGARFLFSWGPSRAVRVELGELPDRIARVLQRAIE